MPRPSSPRVGLCFCHGWGFSAEFWNPLLAHFPNHPQIVWDLGYLNDHSVEIPQDRSIPWIAVGHSLGLRKLLESGFPWSGYIAIQAFHDFLGTPPRLRKIRERNLQEVIQNAQNNLPEALSQFRQHCGEKSAFIIESKDRLMQDLLSLQEPPSFSLNPTLPHLVLASKDDEIVTPPLIETEWNPSHTQWHPHGKHALPLLQTDWVAEKIKKADISSAFFKT